MRRREEAGEKEGRIEEGGASVPHSERGPNTGDREKLQRCFCCLAAAIGSWGPVLGPPTGITPWRRKTGPRGAGARAHGPAS